MLTSFTLVPIMLMTLASILLVQEISTIVGLVRADIRSLKPRS